MTPDIVRKSGIFLLKLRQINWKENRIKQVIITFQALFGVAPIQPLKQAKFVINLTKKISPTQNNSESHWPKLVPIKIPCKGPDKA